MITAKSDMAERGRELVDQCRAYCAMKGLPINGVGHGIDAVVFRAAVADFSRTFADLNDVQRQYIAGCIP